MRCARSSRSGPRPCTLAVAGPRAALRLPTLLLVAAALLSACEEKIPEPPAGARATAKVEPPPPEPKDLIKEDLTVGTGPEAKTGDAVKVHYTGKLLKNGSTFDSSVGKEPFGFTIGEGQVIKGWDEGVPGMKVGGKRKLTIPSRLAYGDAGSPPKIPPKATLVFEIELLSIEGKSDGASKADAGATGKDAAKKTSAGETKKK